MSKPTEKSKVVKPKNQVISATSVQVVAVEIEVADNSGMPVPDFVVGHSRKVKYYAFVAGDTVTIFDKLEPARGIPKWATDGILAKVAENKATKTPDKAAQPGPNPAA